jgi:hypothetical protein
MKKSLLTIAILAATVAASVQNAFGQENPDQMSIRVAGYEVRLNGEDDPSENKNWRRHPFAPTSSYSGRIGLLEVGQPFFRSYDNSYAAYPASEKGFMTLNKFNTEYIAFNFSTFSTSLVRGQWLGATMGLGVAYTGYSLDQPTALANTDRMLHPIATENTLDKSKIRSWWMHVPLVLEFNPTRDFFVSAGGYMDAMIWSGAKWKSPKQKLSNTYMNPLQLGLTARIGFRNFYFFGKYSLSEFFIKDKGPRLNQYTFGMGFNI